MTTALIAIEVRSVPHAGCALGIDAKRRWAIRNNNLNLNKSAGFSLMKDERVQLVTTLRGVAALFVLVSHYIGVFWTGQGIVEEYAKVPAIHDLGIPWFVWAAHPVPLLNWGPFGVALFFIISGFVIPPALRSQTLSYFAVNRILRIYPVYLAGLIVTVAALAIGAVFYGKPFPFSVSQIAVHFPMIREIVWSPSFDGIIWTLEIEIKFYIVCGLAISWFRNRPNMVFWLPVVILGAGWLAQPQHMWMQYLLNNHVQFYKQISNIVPAAHYLIFMFIGVAANYSYKGMIKRRTAAAISVCLFALFLLLWRSSPYGSQLFVAWNYAFAVALFAFAYAFEGLFRKRAITQKLAKLSYPLYASHAIFGYVLMHFLIVWGTPAEAALVFAGGAALALAWAINRTVEERSNNLSEMLKGRMMGRKPDVH